MLSRVLAPLGAPLCLCLVLSASGCGSDDGEGDPETGASTTGDGDPGDGDPGDGDGDPGDGDGDPTSGDGDGDGDPGDGDGDPTSGDGDGDPIQLSHAADIQPILTANCVDSCHEPGGLSSFMNLTDSSYDDIVNVPAAQAGGFMRVQPGASDQSYLMAKLRGTPGDLGGQGARMPAGGAPPLDDATLDLIAAWIDGGALP